MSPAPTGLRSVPWIVSSLLAAPVAVGLAGVILPAFGYLPALGGEAFTLDPFRDLAVQSGLLGSSLLSLATGLITTLVSVMAVALFLAAYAGSRPVRIARRALGPLLAIPHAAAAFGLAFLIAPSGLLVRLAAGPLGLERPPDLLIVGDPFGLAMMAGLIAKEVPFLLLVAFAAMPQADPERRTMLARSLGYGRMAAFLFTVWPAVYRQIRLPVLAVVAFASSVVDVALILGPSVPPTLAVRLLEWMGDPDLSKRFLASAGALLQLAVTAAALIVWIWLERAGGAIRERLANHGRRLSRDGALRAGASLPVVLAGLSLVLGLFMLVLWSFSGFWSFPDPLPPSLSLSTWTRALPRVEDPLVTTALVAALSGLIALGAVILMLETHRQATPRMAGSRPVLPALIAGLLYLPLIVPQIAFVFGLQILVVASGAEPSLWLLVAVHLVFVAPYVALALVGPWFALEPRYEVVAASLGHGRLDALLRVRVPLLLAPILTSFAIGFAVSVGQYLPTVLIGAGRLTTITTEAVALASGGNRRVIGVYALLQTIIPALVFLVASLLPGLAFRSRRGMEGA
ncbi:ABC transporter permease [Fulvimarina sp. 2208YS6-2-32]|uniref:ABC transporter permease n=1 Tax=Fulvimarina uroteuthidis TaxID=3098149 RepID=A0ABU5HX01_9HYPH|nr:ABC transporter permease [Fulvimarina sp. 2208YS6-2-32]MDY8107672.1 ABC transporter permease [Fulvimarina sp. 2208YS6-2-32]